MALPFNLRPLGRSTLIFLQVVPQVKRCMVSELAHTHCLRLSLLRNRTWYLQIQVCLTMSSVWKWTRPQLIRAILVANQFIRVFPYAKFSLSCCKIIINNKMSSSPKRDWCSAYFQSLSICLNLPLQFFKTF